MKTGDLEVMTHPEIDDSIDIASPNFKRSQYTKYGEHFIGAKPISIAAVSSTQVFVLYDNGVIKRVWIDGNECKCPEVW